LKLRRKTLSTPILLTPEKHKWINWANEKADWVGTLINKPNEKLDS